VLLIGAGGLGSPAAVYLAAAGVGRIGIVDDDLVDASNLQRKGLHSTGELGQSKAESARRTLEELNPDVQVVTYDERMTSENVDRILADGWELDVDGADNFPTRYLVNDASVWRGIPVVHGSIYRFEGQVTVFKPHDGPCYRCLGDAVLEVPIAAREYQANNPDGLDELRPPYLSDDNLDLTAWSRDAALALKSLLRDAFVSTSTPSICTPNGLTPNTIAWRPSLKVPSSSWMLSSLAMLSRLASVARTAPCGSKARIPKWIAVAEYHTSTSVESSAATPSTGENCEKPVSSDAARHCASSSEPSTALPVSSSRGGFTRHARVTNEARAVDLASCTSRKSPMAWRCSGKHLSRRR